MIRVSNSATGTLSTAADWLQGNNNAQPASYTAASAMVVDNTSIRYTTYFTPSNATDYCAGALMYVGFSQTTSNDITCDLMEGTSVRASAVITFSRSQTAGHGPCLGWAFFKFATPYQYGNTTASTWRFRLSGANAQDVAFKYAIGGTTLLAYVEVLNATGSPTTNDSLVICGNGNVAGTYNSTTITVDTSLAIGTAAIAGLSLSRGGTLTWGDSQSASYTLTITNNIRMASSEVGQNTFVMGSAEHPLTKDYIQKLIFVNSAANNESVFFLSDNYFAYYGANQTPPNVSIYGNYQFNQNALSNYKSTLASTVSLGGTSIVFAEDLGLRVGGGDRLILGSTGTTGRGAEIVTTSAYDAGTKTATIGATTYEHKEGAYVRLLSCNAVIESSSSTYTTTLFSGTPSAGTFRTHLELSHVEFYLCSGISLSQQPDTVSVFEYLRATGLSGGVGFAKCTMLNCSLAGGASVTMSGVKCKFIDPYFVDLLTTSSPLYTGADLIEVEDGYLDGFYISMYTGGIRNKLTNTRIFASSYGANPGQISSGCVLENVIFGSPTKNTSPDVDPGSLFTDTLYYNCALNSDTQVSTTSPPNMTEGASIRFQLFNQTANDHRIYQPEGIIQTSGASLSDTTTRTPGAYCLKFSPFTAHDNSTAFLSWTQKKTIKANQSVVIQGYMRKNSSWGSTNRPSVYLESADGVIDTSVTMTDVDDTWELFTLAGQVGANDTYITLKYEADSHNASAAAYFADVMCVVGDSTAGSASGFMCTTLWREGEPSMDDLLGGTVDGSFLSSAVWDALETDHTVTGSFGKCVSTIKKWVNILFGGL